LLIPVQVNQPRAGISPECRLMTIETDDRVGRLGGHLNGGPGRIWRRIL